MKKKYWIILIIIVLILPLIIFFKEKKNIDYFVNDFKVKETLLNNKTLLTIENEKNKYYYLFEDKKKKNIVKKIDYYETSDYNCIFLSLNEAKINDLICNKNDVNYYFSTIDKPLESLQIIYKKLVNDGEIKIKINDIYNSQNIGLYEIYNNNLYDDLNFALTNYKGLYVVNNKKIEEIKLFDKDVYEQKIKVFDNAKYIIADYNQQYDFDTFYVVDLKSLKVDKIKFKCDFSFNSEIIDIKNDIIYLYNFDNKKYYEINLNNKKAVILDKVISNENKFLEDYEIIKETEYNYYLIKDNKLYETLDKSLNMIYYVLDLDNKNNLNIYEDYICWLEKNSIKCYHNHNFNEIVSSNEFSFNKTLNYTIFR